MRKQQGAGGSNPPRPIRSKEPKPHEVRNRRRPRRQGHSRLGRAGREERDKGKELNFEGRGEGRDSVLKTRAWCLTKEYEP